MPPRLSHRKSRTGCQRCKTRRVKCDEAKPSCSKCSSQNVSCEYRVPTMRTGMQRNTPAHQPDTTTPPVAIASEAVSEAATSKLELQLMHQWTSSTCFSFSTACDFWQSQAPAVALEHRHVLDAVLSLAALDRSRKVQPPEIILDGRTVILRNPIYHSTHPRNGLTCSWKGIPEAWKQSALGDSTVNISEEATASSRTIMMLISRSYFNRAVESHRSALTNITLANIEAMFLTSVLISFCALFTLGETDEDGLLPTQDPVQWLQLGKGIYHVGQQWKALAGSTWIIDAGMFYGQPDLTDATELFDYRHCKPFENLLTWGREYEATTPDENKTYQMVLSYIGCIYSRLIDGTHDPFSISRLFTAFPSRCPVGFADLVQAKRSRALVMLAYVFTLTKLLARDVPLFAGIAERQVPTIYDQLPTGWKTVMDWPMAVTNGDVERSPIDDTTYTSGNSPILSHEYEYTMATVSGTTIAVREHVV